MKRAKLKAARQRERNKEQREREEQQLLDNAQKLRTMTSGLLKGGEARPVKKSVYVPPPSLRVRERQESGPSHKPVRVQDKPQHYDDQMKQREERAQQEIKRKQARVAPIYNKGGYQYVSDGYDVTELGKRR